MVKSAMLKSAPLAAALLAWLTPAMAAACPACANNTSGGPGRFALGFFLMLPFAAAAVVYWFIRAEAQATRAAMVPSVLEHARRSEAR